jgi:hypothetical protein
MVEVRSKRGNPDFEQPRPPDKPPGMVKLWSTKKE